MPPGSVPARGFVIAGGAARFAVHQTIVAEANVYDRLAQYAVLLADAGTFRLFALGAMKLGSTGSGAHQVILAPGAIAPKMTFVLAPPEWPARFSGRLRFPVSYNFQQ